MVPKGMQCVNCSVRKKNIQFIYLAWLSDGASVFPSNNGWIYVSNSELGDNEGGVGVIKFNRDGNIEDIFILQNSQEIVLEVKLHGIHGYHAKSIPKELYGKHHQSKMILIFQKKRNVRAFDRGAAIDPKSNFIYMTHDDMEGFIGSFQMKLQDQKNTI